MAITTWTELAALPNTQKDFLTILIPKKRYQNWTKTGGATNVYHISFASLFEASSDFGDTFRAISSVEHDETELTLKTSIATVDATAGTYWHDTANSLLYIHTTDSANPNSVNTYIVVFFELYISSGLGINGKGKIFSNIYYEPLMDASNLPQADYEQTDIVSGITIKTGDATFQYHNPFSFWDTMWTALSWKNAVIKIYMGGEDLPFSEYQLIYMGSVRQEHWAEDRVWFDTVNFLDILRRGIPFTPLFTTNASSEDRGKYIPLLFGQVEGIIPLLSDNSTGNAHVYTIADSAFQTLKAVDATYDGTTLLTLTTQYTVDLTGCKVTLVNYTPSGTITVDAKGAKISDITGESSTDLMTNASDIIRFLILEVLRLGTSYINSASFLAAKNDNTFELSKYIRYKRNLSVYLTAIQSTVLGNLKLNNDGEFVFDIYEPAFVADDSISNAEIGNFVQSSPISKIYTGIKVHYNPLPYIRDDTSIIAESQDDSYQGVTGTNDRSKYEDKQKSAFKNIYTWIKTVGDANVLLQRLLLLTNSPFIEVDTTIKGIKLYTRMPGNIVELSKEKAPTSTGAYVDEGFQIVQIIKDFANDQTILKLDNFNGLGLYIGRWTSDSAPNYGASSEQQKREQGYWCNNDGLADPSDLESNTSVWW